MKVWADGSADTPEFHSSFFVHNYLNQLKNTFPNMAGGYLEIKAIPAEEYLKKRIEDHEKMIEEYTQVLNKL